MPQSNKNLTIAHILYRFDTGGMERIVAELVNGLDANFKHEIICLTKATQFKNVLNSPHVRIHELYKKPGKDIPNYWRLYTLLRRLKVDIVNTYNIGTLDAQLVAWCAKVPRRIHSEHGRDASDPFGKKFRYRILRKILRPIVHRFVVVSEDLKCWLLNDIGIKQEKVELIYNGVDINKYSEGISDASTKVPAQFSSNEIIVIGTVGRMDPVKNQQSLLIAFSQLLETLPDKAKNLRLMIIGDGPLREELEKSVSASKYCQYIWLPGNCADVPALLHKMTFFVLPSIAEGIALTILEAMATSLPVIATRVGGNPEIVVHGETGTLVQVDDPENLMIAMKTYVENPQLRKRYGEAGYRRVVNNFNLNKMVTHYKELYQTVFSPYKPNTVKL